MFDSVNAALRSPQLVKLATAYSFDRCVQRYLAALRDLDPTDSNPDTMARWRSIRLRLACCIVNLSCPLDPSPNCTADQSPSSNNCTSVKPFCTNLGWCRNRKFYGSSCEEGIK